MGATESCGAEELAGYRQVGQAGAREYQSRKAQGRRAQLGIGERQRGKDPLRIEEMRLEAPRKCVGREEKQREAEAFHGRDRAGNLLPQ